MQQILPDELNKLCLGAKLLQGTKDSPKVLLKNNRLVIKFIYKRNKIFSSSKIYPYAKRFKNNSLSLAKLDIKCPKVFKIFKFQGQLGSDPNCLKLGLTPIAPCDIVFYSYVEGKSLDKIVKSNDYSVLEKLAEFIACLHERGIFFWDLHLGNVLRRTDGAFCLLDIVSVKVYKKSLSIYKRARNLSRLVEVEQKQRGNCNCTLISFGIDKFINLYLCAANMAASKEKKLLKLIKKRLGA